MSNPPTNAGESGPPSPALIFQTLQAHYQSAALTAGIDLGLFTAIADGAVTADAIASACSASPKGIRVLCDYLTILSFLVKTDGTYALSRDSAIFLNQHSPAYMGGIAKFLLTDELTTPYRDFAASNDADRDIDVAVPFLRQVQHVLARR